MTPLIRFEHLYKSFGPKKIYEDLCLDIFKGETITIVGGSGTGKSVLLKLLLGLMSPTSGKIIFDGEEVGKKKHRELIEMRKRVAMLFQGAALFDSLTVGENVAYPLREHFRYPEEKIAQIVAEKLELVGLPNTEQMMPSDLSGGMRKRVGLARSIATNPEVILYDEPTTGLDPTNTRRIDDLILSMQAKLKVTSIVVTHDMASAFRVSDRIALLYKRKIEYVGSRSEVENCENEIMKRFVLGKMEE